MLDRLQALLRKMIDAAGAVGALCVFLLFVLMIVGGIGRQLNLQVSGINDLVAWLCAAASGLVRTMVMKILQRGLPAPEM
jgi:hypothetical protein